MNLPILRMHENSPATTADVIDCVATGLQNGRGAEHRANGGGSHYLQSDDAVRVHAGWCA